METSDLEEFNQETIPKLKKTTPQILTKLNEFSPQTTPKFDELAQQASSRFEESTQKLAREIKNVNATKSEQFNDPVALQTKWLPMERGGARFITHNLVKTAPDRMELKASLGSKVTALFIIILGFGMALPLLLSNLFKISLLFVGIFIFHSSEFLKTSSNLSFTLLFFDLFGSVFSLVGLIFSVAGGYLWYDFTTPIVFDKRQGFFFKGREKTSQIMNANSSRYKVKLKDVYAIQLISKRVIHEYTSENYNKYETKYTSFVSYELNLVSRWGERIYVIGHGNLAKIREQARMIAEFLDKPVWDVA